MSWSMGHFFAQNISIMGSGGRKHPLLNNVFILLFHSDIFAHILSCWGNLIGDIGATALSKSMKYLVELNLQGIKNACIILFSISKKKKWKQLNGFFLN